MAVRVHHPVDVFWREPGRTIERRRIARLAQDTDGSAWWGLGRLRGDLGRDRRHALGVLSTVAKKGPIRTRERDGLCQVDLEHNPCAAEARGVLAYCKESNCEAPRACEKECEAVAAAVLDECLDSLEPGEDEAVCAELAQAALLDCLDDNCERPEPSTCEDRCADAGRKLFEMCVDAGCDEDRCAKIAREAVAKCKAKHCTDHAPTCEDKCEMLAKRVYEACTRKLDDEELCGKIARHIERHCNEWCDDRECCCDGHCDDGDSDWDKVPPGHLPPPGKCRIWYPDRPPGHQPPPGDCRELERQVPPRAWLIRG